jgi:cysteinyl-tRNA synthetase
MSTGTKLRLYNTLSRDAQEVMASKDHTVRIYCCGPTVYRDAHVGNLRTFMLSDLVARAIRQADFEVVLVQNITDVGHMSDDFEDKMLAQASLENRDPFAVAREYETRFHKDLALLNITLANLYPRASETIDLMQELISDLIAKNSAYVGEDGSVYFSAESFPSYGAISGNRLDSLKPGHRYEYTDDGAKKFHADWALWKAAGNRTQMIWPSPWGDGFPGWHIECSAMSLQYLDGHVDLHIGGIDLRFPHHENERAQSNAATNTEVVDHWLHGEHLLFEGRKMSKSAGNVVLLSDVIARGLDPLSLRLTFLENRYRNQMDLTWDSLIAGDSTLKRWRLKMAEWGDSDGAVDEIKDSRQEFLDAINNDLDTPRALQILRKIERAQNISDLAKRTFFRFADGYLGLNLEAVIDLEEISPEIVQLLETRATARVNKDFATSDQMRDQLLALGIEVQDSPDGQKWSRII